MQKSNLIKSKITTQQFLDQVHGPDAKLYFNVGRKTWKNKPQTFKNAENKLNWLNQHKNEDICFIVNTGGTKDKDITGINANFIDWDVGKDKSGNYLPIDIVNKYKKQFLNTLHNSPLYPSFIIETRNGYHAYWLTDKQYDNVDIFSKIQRGLIYYFKSDPSVINPSQVMRLPGYTWFKSHAKCKPFDITIHEYNNTRYSYINLLNSFPSVSDYEFKSYKQKVINNECNNNKGVLGAHNNSFSYYKDNTCDINVGTYHQDKNNKHEEKDIILYEGQSAIDYIKKQNLAEYLKIEGYEELTAENPLTLKCPFHDDTNPSARIFIDKDTGYNWFYCHSSKCNFKGTIIDVVIKQKDISTSKAIQKLIDYYDMREDEEWIKKQRDKLSKNIDIINNIEKYKEKYPYLYKTLFRIKTDLESKLKFALKNIKLKTKYNELAFICSLRKMDEISRGYSDGRINRQNQKVDRYCLLGLMRKLPDREIPKSLLENTYEVHGKIKKAIARRKSKDVNIYRTQLYTIPAYTEELLEEADYIAKSLKECSVRMNAISRDTILEIFGTEKAKEVYPQINSEKISKSGEKLKKQIEQIILNQIEENGYTTVNKISEEPLKEIGFKSVTDRRVKKLVPGLLIKNGLKELTCNKKLKEKYKIDSRGYPKIIIKK